MTISIGRQVILKGHISNGTDEHPATVTRVWSSDRINVTAMPDCAPPTFFADVKLYATREDAALVLRAGHADVVAFWPPRT